MNKPYLICHMMCSIDGRIDCSMTSCLQGVDEYYQTLEDLKVPTTISGRVTAEKEMARPEKFRSSTFTKLEKESFYIASKEKGYEVIFDSKGTLLWEDQEGLEKPLLVLLSYQASEEYLSYLKENHISYIVTGKEEVDMKRAMEILFKEFHVERAAVVGGPHINAAFLKAGLLDEISLLMGPGIDGRKGELGVFDGLEENTPVTPLKLESVKTYSDGAIWIRYLTK